MSLWIDLTDFLQWKGNMTGIQRIQFNISKLYITSGKNVRFFVYKEGNMEFTEVEFKPDEIVKSGIVGASENTTDDIYIHKARLLAARIRNRIVTKQTQQSSSSRNVIKAPFTKEDTVLIMGGIWAGDFIKDLGTLKEERSFKLIHFAFDMIPSLFPGYVVDWLPEAFRSYQKHVFSISEGIIAISESTASDVRSFIDIHQIANQPDITVVRIGETVDELSVEKSEKSVSGLEPGFILSVSTIEARKNHQALYYMLREAEQRGIALPKIVIVGRNGWHTDDFRYVAEHDPVAREGIVILNDVDDETLVWLYRNCLLTVFPSFYEGWGMPIAESLAYGKYCISSNTSSMPEIAGDMIEYFSPYDTGGLLQAVLPNLDPAVLRAKEVRIKKHYKPTSWHDMFEQVDTFVKGINTSD